MRFKSYKTIVRSLLILVFTLVMFGSITIGFYNNIDHPELENIDISNEENLNIAAEDSFSGQFLNNPNLNSPLTPWYESVSVSGDSNDVELSSGGGVANITIIGNNYTYDNIRGTPTGSKGWVQKSNTNFPILPDYTRIDNFGCFANHTWIDGDDPNQTVSVHWDKNITLPVDMSDYEITSVSLSATFNATVQALNGATGGIDAEGEGDQQAEYDNVRFYVLVSDLNKTTTFEMAYNQTKDLGSDTGPITGKSNETMFSKPEEVLISYLTTILETDPTHRNLTVSLGMRIYCADNYNNDDDFWNDLRITQCNFSFSYSKKINKLTAFSLNQDIGGIGNNRTRIDRASLDFAYKINDNWTKSSLNSELRVLIDNVKHSETIKLVDYVFKDTFESTSYDITSLVTANKSFNVKFQLYLADDFMLNNSIVISLDYIHLNVWYTTEFDDYSSNLVLIINGEDKTSDPVIEIPIGEDLNVAIKYLNSTSGHIEEAEVSVSGSGYVEEMTEDNVTGQYNYFLNATEKLTLGVNLLSITAAKEDYQTKSISPRITVRRLNTTITTINQNNTIEILPDEDFNLTVVLRDEDNNETIKGALVTYQSELGNGFLTDDDNDGIYETVIPEVSDGSYTFYIDAIVSDRYNVEPLEIYLSTNREPVNLSLFILLTTVGVIVAISLGSYVLVYYKVLQYPKPVRKVREFRKKLKKRKTPKIPVVSRDGAFINIYNYEVISVLTISKLKPGKLKKEKQVDAKDERDVSVAGEAKKSPSNKLRSTKTNSNRKITGHFVKSILIFFLLVSTILVMSLNNYNLNEVFYQDNSDNFDIYEKNENIISKLAGENIYQKQWINNSQFDFQDSWEDEFEGDDTDIDTRIENGEAKYELKGEQNTFTPLIGVPRNDTTPYWYTTENPDFPDLPENHDLNSRGFEVNHTWDELADQQPSVHYEMNISMPVDMSEYEITDVSLGVQVNATPRNGVTPEGGRIETIRDIYYPLDAWSIFDYVRFYVLFSDIPKNLVYEVAYNQTEGIGSSGVNYTLMENTTLTTVPLDRLIEYLSSVLSTDNYNFTIILGIRIYCEDNIYTSESDHWDEIMINNCNLTITYEKKINQLTSASWRQDCDAIPSVNAQLTKANLTFKYKISESWIADSPNSELRIYIDETKASEAIKLADYIYSGTFIEAKFTGFDLKSLIPLGTRFNFSIELYIADEFNLSRPITISIDNVSLDVSYTIFYSDTPTNLDLFLDGKNKTSDPVVEVPANKFLNLTVNYTTQGGTHISGASVVLRGERITKNLAENSTLNQYTLIFNVSEYLILGVNQLTISAENTDYISQTSSLRVKVRKINTTISTESGVNKIDVVQGENVNVNILLEDNDYRETISGAIITYSWEYGQGFLQDPDNDGVYQLFLENPPEGTYTIQITAFIGDDYDIEVYELVVTVSRPLENLFSFWIITISSIIGALGTGIFVFLYLTVFKYPKPVRKIRKFKRYLKKKKSPKIDVNSKDQSFKNAFQLELEQPIKYLRTGSKVKSMKKQREVKEDIEEEIKAVVEDGVISQGSADDHKKIGVKDNQE